MVYMYYITYIYPHSFGKSILCPEDPLWAYDNLWESAINKTYLIPAGRGLTVSLGGVCGPAVSASPGDL